MYSERPFTGVAARETHGNEPLRRPSIKMEHALSDSGHSNGSNDSTNDKKNNLIKF